MSPINRRHFLQFAGSALTAMGLSQADFLRQANQYAKVLAQTTPRKLALLIGINDYPAPDQLGGCLTDVNLQRELLVHRFGFNPKDVYVVPEKEATRQGILDAFKTYLIDQAKPGDVVVFHFSGHGSKVIDPTPIPEFVRDNKGLNGTIVPIDRATDDPTQVRDIMGKTLFLLTSALKTENVTVILDSCYSEGGLRGNSRVRAIGSRLGGSEEYPFASPQEVAYQDGWLRTLSLSHKELQHLRTLGTAKGFAIGSAKLDQEALELQSALELPIDGFDAGAFTYLLTRYLWQLPSSQPLSTMFDFLSLSTKTLAIPSIQGTQDPIFKAKPDSQSNKKPIFFVEPAQPSAEAVIHKPLKGKQVEFWLGGASPRSLASYQPGAVFNIIDSQGNVLGEIEQTDRKGLIGYGRVRPGTLIQVQEGMLLREKIRGVPTNLKLRVGLDPSLGKELETIRDLLKSMNRIEVLPINQKQKVDVLLGRLDSEMIKRLHRNGLSDSFPENSYSLFKEDLTPIPGAIGKTGETFEQAMTWLRPRFTALLSAEVLRSVLGNNTSSLKVSVDVLQLNSTGKLQTVVRRLNSRATQDALIKLQSVNSPIQPLNPGAELQVNVKNDEQRAIYIAVLVIASSGDLGVLYPVGYDAPDDASLVKAQSELLVEIPFIVQGPAGFFELLILASKEPLRGALLALNQIAEARGLSRGTPINLQEEETLDVLKNLVGDIDRVSRAGLSISPRYRAFDTGKLATLSAIFEVVEA